VIAGHAVRAFCNAIGSLSRIGKDLYLEFDAIDGLALRTLNDAKSAYACFRFEPVFFERCTSPPLSMLPRSTISSSRKRRQTIASADDSQGLTPTQDSEARFSCRIAIRALAPIIRQRKNVVSLRVRSEISEAVLFLSFEFHVQSQDTVLTVVHRMKAADANGVTPVASTEDSSEIRGSPKTLLRLLDPLKTTVEAALVIRSDAQTVSASSFHHSDTMAHQARASNNVFLQTVGASLLKTETAIGCGEFEEFDFHQNRSVSNDEDIPEDVNAEVILVFPIKEAKSVLQFCSHSHLNEDLSVTLHFHWGGKPLILESTADTFSVRLVLATLDYKLLAPLRSISNNEN
jgi:hypothetical protein